MFCISVNTNVPRHFLDRFAGVEQLGRRTALLSLTVACSIADKTVGRIAVPRLAIYDARHSAHEFRALLVRVTDAARAVGSLAQLPQPGSAPAFFGCCLANGTPTWQGGLVLVMWAAAVQHVGSANAYAKTAAHRSYQQVPLALVSVAVSSIACTQLVPNYRLHGAALSLISVAVAVIVGRLWCLRKDPRLRAAIGRLLI